MHNLQQNLPQQIKDFVKDELNSRNLGGSSDVNKMKDQIYESFDMIQQRMIDTLEELKANKVGALMHIQNTSKRDMVEAEDEVRVVEKMIDKDFADKQRAPTKIREIGNWAHCWGSKI